MPDPAENLHQGHRTRLRQRYLAQGLEAFQPHEALELLLFYAIPRRDTNLLAHRLLKRFGSLNAVLSARPEELIQVEGVGEHTAVLLSLVKPLAGLAQRGKAGNLPLLRTNQDLRDYCLHLPFEPGKETFYLLCLDAQWRVLRAVPLFTGTIDMVSVHARVVVETALRHHAYSVLAVHNHPSNVSKPSQADIEITQSLRAALEAVDIPLIDHIIVSDGRTFSMRRWTDLEEAKLKIDSDFQRQAADGAGTRRSKKNGVLKEDATFPPFDE